MIKDLQRRLYEMILYLHPAAFRDEFAREMALDFEEARHSYGLGRLYLDAAGSLTRQWMAGISSGAIHRPRRPGRRCSPVNT